MADPARPGLFAFASTPLPPDAPADYQTGATMLKILGWLRVVGAAFSILAVFAALLIMLVGAAFLGPFLEQFPLGGLGAAVLGGILLVVALLALAVSIGFLYWTSWIFAKWAALDTRALQHAKIMAIVTIVLSGLSLLGSLTSLNIFSIAVDGGTLAVAIILLMKAGAPDVQAMFGAA